MNYDTKILEELVGITPEVREGRKIRGFLVDALNRGSCEEAITWLRENTMKKGELIATKLDIAIRNQYAKNDSQRIASKGSEEDNDEKEEKKEDAANNGEEKEDKAGGAENVEKKMENDEKIRK